MAQTGSLNLACCASAMIIIGAATATDSCAAPDATGFGLGWVQRRARAKLNCPTACVQAARWPNKQHGERSGLAAERQG